MQKSPVTGHLDDAGFDAFGRRQSRPWATLKRGRLQDDESLMVEVGVPAATALDGGRCVSAAIAWIWRPGRFPSERIGSQPVLSHEPRYRVQHHRRLEERL